MLSRAERLVSADDYRRTVRRGRRSSSALMTAYAVTAPDASTWRFGFIVSKAVGNAVVRNRVRRRLKAVCRSFLSAVPDETGPMDVVFRAHPAAATAAFAELEAGVLSVLTKLSSDRRREVRDSR